MRKLSIRQKLLAITIILFVPLVGLAGLIGWRDYGEVRSIETARSGVMTLRQIWPAAPAAALNAAPRLASQDGLWRALSDASGQHSLLPAPMAAGAKDPSFEDWRAVLQVAADSFNLHATSDLTSAYLADVVTTKLPDMVLRLALLRTDAARLAATRGDFDDVISFLVSAGSFKVAADSLDVLSDGLSAIRTGSTTSAPLANAFSRLTAANVAFQERAAVLVHKAGNSHDVAPTEREAFDAAYLNLIRAVDEAFKASAASLDERLSERRASTLQTAELSIGTAVGSALLGLFLSAALSLSIVRRIGRLEAKIIAAAEAPDAADFADLQGDEVARISRSIQTLSDRNNARLRSALEADHHQSDLERQTALASEMASVVHEVSAVVRFAAAGDFSRRATVETARPELGELVSGVNAINEVVDKATAEFARVLSAIADGDLTQTVSQSYAGRFEILKTAINGTVERLSGTVEFLQGATKEVSKASEDIKTGADELSSRTESEARSLGETASTSNRLAASVRETAEAALLAVDVARKASQTAEGGGSIAGRAVEAMGRIETASKSISEITDVIEEIAFQTNLLALNAAVEAARAGQAGKGFAVVAAEVRTLAKRSAEAAQDIAILIRSAAEQVSEGVHLVREAGGALDQIVHSSLAVASTVTGISAAAADQVVGVSEMTEAMTQLDHLTKHNAVLAEHSAASAATLQGLVSRLDEAMGTFRTKTHHGQALDEKQASRRAPSGVGRHSRAA